MAVHLVNHSITAEQEISDFYDNFPNLVEFKTIFSKENIFC